MKKILLLSVMVLAYCCQPTNAGQVATAPNAVVAGNNKNKTYKKRAKKPTINGTASWYGPGFYGETTASGIVYRRKDVFAAHKDLPFGTKIRVTNTENGRSIEVEVQDRGPYKGDRVLDLTHEAAKKLGMIEDGLVPVKIVILG